MSFLLSTDTACDLLKGNLDNRNVYWIPLTFTINGETFEDNFTTDQEYLDFYDKLKAGAMPTTSQINTYTHEAFFNKVLENGDTLIHLTLSGGLSETVNSARIAAKNIMEKSPSKKVIIIDSKSATQGHAVVLEKAIALRDSNLEATIAASELEAYILSVHHWFMVDDLHHLKRGGRISRVAAAFGTLLKIKPVLTIQDDGKLHVMKKVKGIKAAINYFLETAAKYKTNETEFFIVNGGACENAKVLEQKLKDSFPSNPVRIGWVGPVIGAHTGGGMFGVAFYGKARVK